MLEISKPLGLKMWALVVSLVTGLRAALVQEVEVYAVLALMVTKMAPGMLAPPSSEPARPA